jgi:hypothetical protein
LDAHNVTRRAHLGHVQNVGGKQPMLAELDALPINTPAVRSIGSWTTHRSADSSPETLALDEDYVPFFDSELKSSCSRADSPTAAVR